MLFRSGRLLSIATLLLIVLLGACGSKDTPEALYKKADAAYSSGDVRTALIHLKNALQAKPDLAEGRYLLGVMLNGVGNGAAAEAELKRAQDLGLVLGGRVIVELGNALFQQQKYKQLLETIKPTPAYEPTQLAEIFSYRGRAHLGLGQVAEARKEQEEAVKASPNSPAAALLLARIHISEGEFEESLKIAEQVIAAQPRYLDGLLLRADLLALLGRDDEMLAAYGKILEVSPDNVVALAARANAYILTAKYDLAQKDVDHLRRVGRNNPGVPYLQALIHFTQGRYPEAETAVQEALKISPAAPNALLLSASIAYARGAYAQAEQILSKLVFDHPHSLFARKLLASALIQLNEDRRALEVIAPAMGKGLQDGVVLALAGNAHLRGGELGKATKLLKDAAAADPKNPTYRTQLALARMRAGALADAVVDLEDASAKEGGASRNSLILVLTLLQSGQLDKALATAQEIVKQKPDNPSAHNLLGIVQVARNDKAAAHQSFEQALKVRPGYLPAASNLAKLDLLDNKPAEAKKRYEGVLASSPKNVDAMLALSDIAQNQGLLGEAIGWLEKARAANGAAIEPRGRLTVHYVMLGDTARAMEVAQEALAANPDHPAALDLVGNVLLERGEFNSALSNFSRMVSVAPRLPLAQIRLARAYEVLGKNREAEGAYRQALTLQPGTPEAEAGLARLLARSGRFDEALQIAEKTRKNDPKSPLGYLIEGEVRSIQKRYAEAAKAFESAQRIAPDGLTATRIYVARALAGDEAGAEAGLEKWAAEHPADIMARMFLAEGYLQRGENRKAVDGYRKILTLTPNNLLAMNNLAIALNRLKDPEALAVAEKAYEQRPDNALIADTLGWMLVERGEFQKALPLLKGAARAAPENGEIRYHYAVALAKTGEKLGAKKELEELLASGRPFPQAKEAQQLLSTL